MKQLLEDYKRRLENICKMILDFNSNGSINDIKKEVRLTTKASEYRSIITDLEHAISNTPKFETKYILFGEEVCRMFFDEGIKGALKLARKGDVDIELFVWNENTTPADLLSAYDGQGGYAFLSESEYKKFAKI